MFDESGKKLQSLAIVVFIINVIAFIILAIVFGWTKETYSGWYTTHTETVFHAGAFFGFLIGGIGGSYVECLAIYAFGELVENSQIKRDELIKCKELLVEMSKDRPETKKKEDLAPKKREEIIKAKKDVIDRKFEEVPAGENKNMAAVIPLPGENDNSVLCPLCGTKQNAGRTVCWHCGVKFESE